MWETLEQVLHVCEWEEIDLLLIAGDLFHRQPLLRELKELNFMFSKLTKTQVVFVAGNHDYLKLDSYYHSFKWSENVHPLLNGHMGGVEFRELHTTVYGLSYYQREIRESLYDRMFAPGKQTYEILLAHGGDETHIPIKKDVLEKLGYDYIALGHIHKPQCVLGNRAIYAGALEPIDKNDVGKHGYVYGEITADGVKTKFIPCAKREYCHLAVEVDEETTTGSLKDTIYGLVQQHGIENMYKFILRGFRSEGIEFDLETLDNFGNIYEIVDATEVSYNFEDLLKRNHGNLLGRYIESLKDCEKGSIEYLALYEGVQAILGGTKG